MASREVTEHMDLWTDAPARTFFSHPLRPARIVTARPPNAIKAPRSPWFESVEANARFEINRLDCSQYVNIEGVIVRRTSAHNRVEYTIDSDRGRYKLDTAVSRVLTLSRLREGGG